MSKVQSMGLLLKFHDLLFVPETIGKNLVYRFIRQYIVLGFLIIYLLYNSIVLITWRDEPDVIEHSTVVSGTLLFLEGKLVHFICLFVPILGIVCLKHDKKLIVKFKLVERQLIFPRNSKDKIKNSTRWNLFFIIAMKIFVIWPLQVFFYGLTAENIIPSHYFNIAYNFSMFIVEVEFLRAITFIDLFVIQLAMANSYLGLNSVPNLKLLISYLNLIVILEKSFLPNIVLSISFICASVLAQFFYMIYWGFFMDEELYYIAINGIALYWIGSVLYITTNIFLLFRLAIVGDKFKEQVKLTNIFQNVKKCYFICDNFFMLRFYITECNRYCTK